MEIKSKTEAQQRVDQIDHFRRELQQLEEEDVLLLDRETAARVDRYQRQLISRLSREFDIDSTRKVKQLSLGMKITSFLGALALGASLFFLFYQFWGNFSTATQVGVLVATPLLSLAITFFAARRDSNGYFAKLFGSVSLTCFILNLSMLGEIFNITPTDRVFLVWALFAFILAYAINTRLLLAAGILCSSAFLSARAGAWGGMYWLDFGDHPENFFLPAALFFALSFLRHDRFDGFSVTYRVFSQLLMLIPVLVLSFWGESSYLEFHATTIEHGYQLVGFVGSAALIWLGVKRGWADLVNLGNVFFTIFLYTKFYDWWWDFLPKYLFFLLLGLVAVLMLLVFKRLRQLAVSEVL